jgi:hypothetical protein
MCLALKCWLCAALLAFGRVTLCAQLFLIDGQPPTTALATSNSVTLGWLPSPDTNVAGYFICWGSASGECTNQLDIGKVAIARLGGLETNAAYYFAVIAYDNLGRKSPPSNEIEYALPDTSHAIAAPKLDFELRNIGMLKTALRLSFQGHPGATCHLEATEDFQHWDRLWTTNCPPDGIVAWEVTGLGDRPFRFFRWFRE